MPGSTSSALTDNFFWPKSIAFVGASPDHATIRGKLVMFAVKNKFPGKLYPVNPTHREIDGYKAYPKVSVIGEPVDLAVIAIPAKLVIDAVEDCAAAGVRNVMIIASGFAEEGGAASALQERLSEIAKRTGIRIAGPNCEGFYNALANTAATFSPTVERISTETVFQIAPQKRVGVISQSGGQGFALFTIGRAHGLSFSYVISTGNEVDLGAADFLEYMVRDACTHSIMMLCETIRDGKRFISTANDARRLGKPIVLVKIGKSDAGSRAAASHTASMTGSHSAYQAVFERYGIIQVQDPNEAVAVTALLATCPLPRGRRVGIVTASGGGGAMAADAFSDNGLTVPVLSENVQSMIRPMIPPHATAQNPVDVTAQGGRTGPLMMTCMETMSRSGEVDIVVEIISTAREELVSIIPERLHSIHDAGVTPIALWTYTLPSLIGRQAAAEAGVALFSDIRQCGRALGRLVKYAEHVRSLKPEPPAAAAAPLKLPSDLPPVLSEHRVKTLFACCGIDPSNERLVQSAKEAADAAVRLGFPVALKVQSPDIPHKTEIGGVRINLSDVEGVTKAYDEILTAVKKLKPGARIEGMLVQKMAPNGHELVIGMVNDPTFGPIMMVGMGGVTVELFGDVVHCPAPLSIDDAKVMIGSLRSAKLLQGFRGARPVDIAPAAALIAALSEVAYINREKIQEIEFNPVILHGDGSGLTVADALVMMKK